VQVDLLVPSSLGGPGRRSARLGPHGTEVARKAKGLEAAIVDHGMIRLTALEAGVPRELEVAVAGLAALLVAKLHKLAEREARPNAGLQRTDSTSSAFCAAPTSSRSLTC